VHSSVSWAFRMASPGTPPLRKTGTRMARYLLSLPERVVRSASALAGGLIRELGDVTLPAAVRRTKTYQTMVGVALRFMIQEVGQVEGVYPTQGELANNFLMRRTAGHGIELVGILAFRASPVWIMAAFADISGAGRQVVQEVAEALKQEGLLQREAKFENIDQLLDGLEQTAGRAADVFNTPPLDVAGLRQEWTAFRASARKIPPRNLPSADLVRRHWDELKSEAAAQNRSVFALSSLVAISAISRTPDNLLRLTRAANRAVWRTGQFFGGGLLEHYSQTLRDIRERGYAQYWADEFRPYLRAAAAQFSPKHLSLTDRLLKRKTRNTAKISNSSDASGQTGPGETAN
ncbi:MAG TPA: hypothetical protein VGV35_05235, partial [Bryobacteraceae bacterium]|nr:hypothetical protein [Bryobacteraceae bacterium]